MNSSRISKRAYPQSRSPSIDPRRFEDEFNPVCHTTEFFDTYQMQSLTTDNPKETIKPKMAALIDTNAKTCDSRNV